MAAPIRNSSSADAKLLLDTPVEAQFDTLTQLATQMFDTPVSLVTIIDPARERQFFKSQTGLAEPWASRRETPLTHSFCQHVVMFDEPVVIDDAPSSDLVRHNLAIEDLGVIAYLGAPVRDRDGVAIGAFCVIDDRPRHWSRVDVQTLERLAACASDLVQLRAALHDSRTLRDELHAFALAAIRELREPASRLKTLCADIGEFERTGQPERRRDLLGRSEPWLAQLVGTIDRMSDYARIMSGGLEPDLVDLNALLNECLVAFDAETATRRARIDVDDLPVIRADAAQMRLLLRNLLDNALKFAAPDRACAIALRVVNEPASPDLKLVISDNGIGFEPVQAWSIFSLFKRLPEAEALPGIGIGLTLCERIVRNHGGTIEARATTGKGATFTVHLPGCIAISNTTATGGRAAGRPGAGRPRDLSSG